MSWKRLGGTASQRLPHAGMARGWSDLALPLLLRRGSGDPHQAEACDQGEEPEACEEGGDPEAELESGRRSGPDPELRDQPVGRAGPGLLEPWPRSDWLG